VVVAQPMEMQAALVVLVLLLLKQSLAQMLI
jgi:hypothetical protein